MRQENQEMTLILEPRRKEALGTSCARKASMALVICMLGGWGKTIFGAEGEGKSGSPLGSQIFFDARQTSFNKDTQRQMLEGDVVAIGAGIVLAADQIAFDRAAQKLEAKGHIVILGSSQPASPGRGQVFLGDSLVYSLDSGDFRLTNAIMLVNDAKEVQESMRRLLGFSSAEFAFEASRKARLGEIASHKGRLLGEAYRLGGEGQGGPSPALIDRYTVLVEEERLIRSQENRSLAGMSPERRESLQKRRKFWEESRSSALSLKSQVMTEGFFRISGQSIERMNENDFLTQEALITPCLCERDERPAWAFRADRVFAQPGGYASLKHAVLEINGVPILYLPALTLPLKERRQSGFLLPTFGFQPRSGNIFTQPVYFDLGQAADATVTTDIFENRGTRVGVEVRTQQRAYSGWEFRTEAIRDRLWLTDRATRQEMSVLYRDGLADALEKTQPFTESSEPFSTVRDRWAQILRDPSYWRENVLGGAELTPESALLARSSVEQNLRIPDNAWRGQYGWRGMTFLAPRLSLVSNGEIVSDHRYLEELYAPNDYYAAFLGGVNAKAFSPAKAQLHLDGKDFYAGFGTRYGDNHILNERFEGQGIPAHVTLQSRYFSLLPEKSLRTAPVPVYAQIRLEHIRIAENRDLKDLYAPTLTPTLGEGSWRRLKVNQVAPLTSDGLVQVNQFADAEVRSIEHKALSPRSSVVKSWRTGLEFRLPIDGKGALPDGLTPSSGEKSPFDAEAGRSFVHHLMDWRLRFSARPAIVKDGPYTDESRDPVIGRLAYFASDRVVDPNSPIDSDLPEEERMKIHRRVSISTDQVWKLFRRHWTVLPQEPTKGPTSGETQPEKQKPLDPAEEARRDILEAWQHAKHGDMDKEEDFWGPRLIKRGRYKLQDDYYETPMTLQANVAYDFLDAEARERQRQEQTQLDEEIRSLEATPEADQTTLQDLKNKRLNTRLAEPWKNPTATLGLSYQGFRLSSTGSYSIYLKTMTALGASFAPPAFFSTNISFGYGIGKEYLQREGDFRVTQERSFGLATSLIPRITTNISLTRKVIDGQVSDYTTTVREAAGFSYASPSECWGLQFLREKDFAVDEGNARYLLQLSVIFLGQQRGLPNMSPGIIRQVTQRDPNTAGVPR
jgi:hypothetical protein